jgi:hypothetical protein
MVMAKGVVRRWLAIPLLVVLVLVLLGLFLPSPCLIWDGGYGQAEFQLTLTDEGGKPLEGVELRVEDLEGRAYYHYPVTDYLPDRIPTSDRDGLMVFHHVSQACEFSGMSCDRFGLFRVEVRKGPQFVCRFLLRGTVVHEVRYGDLDQWGGASDVVKRRWRQPTWPASELLMKPDEEYDAWHARAFAFFDLNHNGKLEPEEAAAYHAGTSLWDEEAAMNELRGEPKEEDMMFPIVRKAIMVRAAGR